jgi:hypothetical protein
VFEVFDPLRDAILQNLDLRRLQILNRRTVARGVHVDAHVIRPGAKYRLVAILRGLRAQSGGSRDEHNEREPSSHNPRSVGRAGR